MSLCLPARRASEPAWLRDPLWIRARMVPSLDLDFAGTGSLRDWVSGQNLVTFTRASDGTYVDSQGILRTATTDAPRITHDPTTGKCLGLLVEEARTNLLLRSEEFDNAAWVPSGLLAFGGGSTPNAAMAPNGTTTADLIVESTANSGHFIYQIYAGIVSGLSYTASAYIKPSAFRGFAVGFSGAAFNDQTVSFNHLGVHQGTAGVITDYTIQKTGDWYRVSITATAKASGNGQVRLFIADTTFSYPGDGTSGIYIWGAQLEAGAFPTSYIPTTGTAATRAADIATILSGLDLNTIRGMYAEFINPASGVRGIASLSDNTANERISLSTSGTDPLLTVVDGGATQANIDAGTFAANSITRLAARFGPNDFAVSVNGGAEVVDTSGTMPTMDRLMIGRTQAGEYLNGPLARLVLLDRPPTDLRRLSA